MGGNSGDSKENAALITACWGIIGATAGRLVSHPIDTIKARLQVTTNTSFSLGKNSKIFGSAKEVITKEGITGLYKGLPTAITGSIPGAFLYFGSYEYFKKHTLEIEFLKKHSFISYLAGGMFAETVSWIIFVPVDVLKERLQVQSKLKLYKYDSDFDAIKQVIRNEGIRGLYKAYPATVLSFGPFSALYFMFYEK